MSLVALHNYVLGLFATNNRRAERVQEVKSKDGTTAQLESPNDSNYSFGSTPMFKNDIPKANGLPVKEPRHLAREESYSDDEEENIEVSLRHLGLDDSDDETPSLNSQSTGSSGTTPVFPEDGADLPLEWIAHFLVEGLLEGNYDDYSVRPT